MKKKTKYNLIITKGLITIKIVEIDIFKYIHNGLHKVLTILFYNRISFNLC